MNSLKGFFTPVKYALIKYSLLELAKLFDHAENGIHIIKLIKFSRSNKMTAHQFKEYNQNRELVDEIITIWQGVSSEDITKINILIENNEEIINRLKACRDQALAHNQKKKKFKPLTIEEVKILLSIVEEILNIFSNKTNHTITSYEFTQKECKEHTSKLIRSS